MKKPPPYWLKNLKRVKSDLAGIRWPKASAGFRQGIQLMVMGVQALEDQVRRPGMRHGTPAMRNRVAKQLAAYAKTDMKWVALWKKERVKIFS